MVEPSLTVAILAGGTATRLGGRDKGLEPLGGRPLVASVIDAVHAMSDALKPSPSRERTGLSSDAVGHREPVSARTGMCGPDSRAQDARGLGGDGVCSGVSEPVPGPLELLIIANRHLDAYAKYARTIPDAIPGFHGPLAGIAAALAACTTSWLLTVPVDCPAPPLDLAARLGQAAEAGTADAFVAHDGERRQPLFALYRRTLAGAAAAAVEAGQGVWQWQTTIGARELDFADRRRQFRNLNTPEDFVAYAAEHRLES